MESKVNKLARILSYVHSHSLKKFYEEDEDDFWNNLKNVEENEDEVSKDFFVRMAEDVLTELKIKK
jgi:hypothetical protein